LYMLDLSVNRIAKFPPVIVKIPKLRILHLSYNKLETIDELFAKDCLWSL
jgi:Leucine-rich repeat (LRR) protein